MNSGTNGNGGPQPGADFHVREVVRSAEHELQQLLRQRAEIMKRIGTLKQTLGGLANIFGDWLLDDDLLVLLDRKTTQRRSGFTRACRMVLMNSPTALDAAQIGDGHRHGQRHRATHAVDQPNRAHARMPAGNGGDARHAADSPQARCRSRI